MPVVTKANILRMLYLGVMYLIYMAKFVSETVCDIDMQQYLLCPPWVA